MFDLTGRTVVVTGGGRGIGRGIVRAMRGGGSIIDISSRSGSEPAPMTGQYGVGKAGIESLTATMAVEWATSASGSTQSRRESC